MKEQQETALRAVYNKLKEDKKVSTQKDFADKLKYDPVNVSEMINKKKAIPFKFLVQLYNVFSINANYIISKGKGNIYLGVPEMISLEEIEDLKHYKTRFQALEEKHATLLQQLIDKERIITLLEKKG